MYMYVKRKNLNGISFFLLYVAMSMTGGCSPLPFRAATQTHGELTYSRSHHTQSE